MAPASAGVATAAVSLVTLNGAKDVAAAAGLRGQPVTPAPLAGSKATGMGPVPGPCPSDGAVPPRSG